MLLKSSTDLRDVAPPVTMMALLSSSGISDVCVVDSELAGEVEIIVVVGFVVVIIVVDSIRV